MPNKPYLVAADPPGEKEGDWNFYATYADSKRMAEAKVKMVAANPEAEPARDQDLSLYREEFLKARQTGKPIGPFSE